MPSLRQNPEPFFLRFQSNLPKDASVEWLAPMATSPAKVPKLVVLFGPLEIFGSATRTQRSESADNKTQNDKSPGHGTLFPFGLAF